MTKKSRLEQNIWKFYLYRVFCSLTFFTPVFVLFYQENGLSMTQIMLLQSVYTVIIALTLIPFGILADYIGRKKLLVGNTFLYGISWVLFATGHNFKDFFIAEAIIALSSAMWLASGTPFFYDTLKELKKEKQGNKLMGNVWGINFLMWGLASLVGGYIAIRSLRLPFWLTAAVSFAALIVTFTFTDTKKHKHADSHYLKHLKEACKFAATHPKVRLFIIYSSITYAIGFVGFMLYQPYLKAIGIELKHFGWIYLVMYTFAAYASKIAHKIEKKLGERRFLTIQLAATILVFYAMSNTIYVIGAIFPLVLGFLSGAFEPTIVDYFQKNIASEHRATITSLHGAVIQLVTSIIAPVIGYVVDMWGLQTALVLSAVILTVDLVILVLTLNFIKSANN